MPAGTITLTNNSTAVTGSGTSFTAELKPNDFIVAIVGGITYTLGVQSVGSATGLTLITAYNGPTTSGVAWTAVPNAALVGITAQVAADVARAIRGLNLDKANWQQVFSGTGTITVTLPDGSTYSGPAWGSITASLNGKANSTDVLTKADNLNSVADKATARTNLGLKGAAVLDVGTAASTVAAGNDARLNTVNNKTGGTVSSAITVTNDMIVSTGARPSSPANGSANFGGRFRMAYSNVAGRFTDFYIQENVGLNVTQYLLLQADSNTAKLWSFVSDGNAYAPGVWSSASDRRHKYNFKPVTNPLAAVMSWNGCTYDKLDGVREVGLIAQDVEPWCAEAVNNIGKRSFSDGTEIDDFKALNVAGVSAAYHTEAIKALFSLVELALTDPDSALKHIDEIKAAIKLSDK